MPVSPADEKPYRLLVLLTSAYRSTHPPAPDSFAAVFESLVGRVSAAASPEELALLHAAFEKRTGKFGPDDPWFEVRSRAFWDFAMTQKDAAAPIRAALEGRERAWADALPRAHRGLFEARHEPRGVVVHDVLGGADLLVHEVDEGTTDALAESSSLFDGAVVALASPVRLALLPGAIFHPEEARDAIAGVVAVGRSRGIQDEALLDALLRMELSLRVLSRVKPSYAYRAEALAGR